MRKVVRISMQELQMVPDPTRRQEYIMYKLRDNGIPVNGILFLMSLERGKLTIEKDNTGSAYTYTWTNC